MSSAVLGVDVGGTTTAAGLVAATGEVLIEAQSPTHAAGPGRALATIVGLVETIRAAARARDVSIDGIGLGLPGIIDAESGRVGDEIPHVPELAGQPVAAMLADRFGVPVFVDNDVNALALAEWTFGEWRGVRSLVVLAPGTGFGSGILLDGRLVRGASGFGGELGHAPVKFDGPPCWCGGRGCLAVYASGRGIAEAARERASLPLGAGLAAAVGGNLASIAAPLVFARAAEGDPVAAAIIDEACQALGAMIGTIVNGLNPEVVLVTGGVAHAYAPLEPRILAAAGEYALRRALAATRVSIVPGDKRVTMRGAAALVLYEKRRRAY
jgi:predicted NBD/HSP70 family sugar kinase